MIPALHAYFVKRVAAVCVRLLNPVLYAAWLGRDAPGRSPHFNTRDYQATGTTMRVNRGRWGLRQGSCDPDIRVQVTAVLGDGGVINKPDRTVTDIVSLPRPFA